MELSKLLNRQESLFNWIKEPVNKSNPNYTKVAAYWLRITELIVEKITVNT